MKNQKVQLSVQLLFTPVLLILLGLVLIFHPDFASALIGRVLGWIFLAAGAVSTISALTTKKRIVNRAIVAVVCFAIGGWLLGNPLKLAAAIGRIVGILVAVRGVQDVANAIQWKSGLTFALITAAIGVLLIVLPMTTSRLVFLIGGIVVLLVGIAMLMDRLKMRNRLNAPGDDDIVDAL